MAYKQNRKSIKFMSSKTCKPYKYLSVKDFLIFLLKIPLVLCIPIMIYFKKLITACYSFHGRGLSLQTMVGLGRAAIPQLGAGRGRALPSSFFPGPASELQTAPYSQTSHTGRETYNRMIKKKMQHTK